MTSKRDILLARQRLTANLALDQEIFKGKIIEVLDSEEKPSVFVEGKPGHVWVLSEMGTVWAVRNRRVSALPNTDVLVGRAPKPPHRLQILEWDDSNVANLEDEQPLLSLHAEAHEQWDGGAGYDPITVYTRMLADGKVWLDEDVDIDNPTLSFNVASLVYIKGDQFVSFGEKTNQDLSAYLPPAGLKWRVLVYINRLSNQLSFLPGPAVPDIPMASPPYPPAPESGIPLAFFELSGGMAGFYEAHIEDARQPIGGAPSLPPASLPGQILYTLDGVKFTAELPVTDIFGWLVEESSGLLIVADTR